MGLARVIRHLTRGHHNRFAGTYNVNDVAALEQRYQSKGGNIFTLQYTHEFGSLETNVAELKHAIEDVCRITGADEIDIVAESKGTVEIREYLRQGNDLVRNLILMVPPNRGFPLEGELSWVMSHLPVKKVGAYPMNPEGRRAIRMFTTDWALGPLQGNRILRRLNSESNRTRESQVLNSLTVVSGGGNNLFKNYLGPGLPLPFLRGDNMVPEWSAYLPHAQNFFFKGERSFHDQVNGHPEALDKVAEVLTTDGHPAKDAHYKARVQSLSGALAEGTLWTTSFVGRINGIIHAAAGSAYGGPCTALAYVTCGLLAIDGGRQDAGALTGSAPVRAKAALNGVAKLAQAVGVAGALAGWGLPAAGLIAGALVVSTFTN